MSLVPSTSAADVPPALTAVQADSAITAPLLLGFIVGYFLLLLGVALWTARRADNASFFVVDKYSNWLLVALGMIGTSLSGVTFISVPRLVDGCGFT